MMGLSHVSISTFNQAIFEAIFQAISWVSASPRQLDPNPAGAPSMICPKCRRLNWQPELLGVAFICSWGPWVFWNPFELRGYPLVMSK